jgi:repressor LexA
MELTARQKNTLEFIENYININTLSPTVEEIAKGISISSKGVVYRYLKALQEKNYITLAPNQKRNIRLKKQEKESSMIMPFLGNIAAGKAIDSVEHFDRIDLTKSLKVKDTFLLKVEGSSMLGDNICDQDLVICEKDSQFHENKILVFIIDNQEVTLKRASIQGDEIHLIPSNPTYKVRTYHLSRVQIQAKYKGLLRP